MPTRRKSKKDDNKSLMDQVLAGMPRPADPPRAPVVPVKKRRDLWAEVERLKRRSRRACAPSTSSSASGTAAS